MTKLELFLKNRSKILLKNAPKIMFLELKNMIFEAFLSKIFERFFPKSYNFVKSALNVKWIYETLVNLLILNKFSLWFMGLRTIFREITLMLPRNPNPCCRILRAFNFIPSSEVIPRSVPFTINAIISPACVGYQYQRFGMCFGVKLIYFEQI